jgi:hypothetical protein
LLDEPDIRACINTNVYIFHVLRNKYVLDRVPEFESEKDLPADSWKYDGVPTFGFERDSQSFIGKFLLLERTSGVPVCLSTY